MTDDEERCERCHGSGQVPRRYLILGVSIPAYVADRDDEWLQYPLVHYTAEAGTQRVAEMNAAVEQKIRDGHWYPFERYKLISISDELVMQYEERQP